MRASVKIIPVSIDSYRNDPLGSNFTALRAG